MREIKFRGYDKENKCWRYGFYTKLQDGCRIYDSIIVKEDDGFTRYYIHDVKTIEQYTGLKDKNDKEIYEGDIISMWYAPRSSCKGNITFNNGSFMFNTKEATPNIEYLGVLTSYGNQLEVIGNLHEA